MRALSLCSLAALAAFGTGACRTKTTSKGPEVPRSVERSPEQNMMREVALKFQLHDADGDGRLSFAEYFRTRISRTQRGPDIFGEADIDGDGFLTPAEAEEWVRTATSAR